MARKPYKSTADVYAEKATLRKHLQEYLDNGGDETAAAYLAAKANGYSDRNAHLVAMQMPGATDVRGYVAWQQAGRQVRKGVTGIRITAPAGRRDAEPPSSDNPNGLPEQQYFRLVSVFDISQTDAVTPDPAPAPATVTESTPVPAGV